MHITEFGVREALVLLRGLTDPEERLTVGRDLVRSNLDWYKRRYPAIPKEVCDACFNHVDEQRLRKYGNSPSVCLSIVDQSLKKHGYPVNEWLRRDLESPGSAIDFQELDKIMKSLTFSSEK